VEGTDTDENPAMECCLLFALPKELLSAKGDMRLPRFVEPYRPLARGSSAQDGREARANFFSSLVLHERRLFPAGTFIRSHGIPDA
jgi:hypothetical protein